MAEIIDLYSKFLLAFVGVITPAIAFFLNNYLIDRTRFEKIIKQQKAFSGKLIQDQLKNEKQDGDGTEFYELSNKLLKEINEKLGLWETVVGKLDPKKFFKQNLLILAGSLFFLFVWLFVRTSKVVDYNAKNYLYQIVPCAISIALCVWHIINLIQLGFYLIKIRPVVDEINEHIEKEKEKNTQPIEVPKTPNK